VEADGSVPSVFDAAALRQVLLNLTRNAVEALGDAGTLSIGCRSETARASITVADDGPGIPESDLENVFEFGFSTKPRGNGLGLPIVHRLVTEMGGNVAIRSKPGEGTIVVVTLPLATGGTATGI
jgi:signal transduction histidine kinase